MTCNHHPDDNFTRIPLNEMYYKDIMRKIVPGWLPHKDYSHLIKSVTYKGNVGNTLRFFVPNKYNGWYTYVRFVEWDDQVLDLNINPVEAARLLLWGANLKLHCTCPAHLFWGYQYIQTQYDAAIVPEMRPPVNRNPTQKGFVCKHQKRCLSVMPWYLGDMASAIKKQRSQLK